MTQMLCHNEMYNEEKKSRRCEVAYLCSIMEEADVPTWTKGVQEFHQCTWSLREDKPAKQFIFNI